jgi:bZIP transcription factor
MNDKDFPLSNREQLDDSFEFTNCDSSSFSERTSSQRLGGSENEGKSVEMLFAGMGNLAAACDAANAACKRPFQSEEEKLEGRRNANRRSAKMSRHRKKMESEQLQERAAQLAQANLALMKENLELRKQISILLRTKDISTLGEELQPSPHMNGFMDGSIMQQSDSGDMEQHLRFSQTNQQLFDGNSLMPSSLPVVTTSPNAALITGSQLAYDTLQLITALRSNSDHFQTQLVSPNNGQLFFDLDEDWTKK